MSKPKEKKYFEDFQIGEEFTRNEIRYRKVSDSHATTQSLHGTMLKEVSRYFDGPAKAVPIS